MVDPPELVYFYFKAKSRTPSNFRECIGGQEICLRGDSRYNLKEAFMAERGLTLRPSSSTAAALTVAADVRSGRPSPGGVEGFMVLPNIPSFFDAYCNRLPKDRRHGRRGGPAIRIAKLARSPPVCVTAYCGIHQGLLAASGTNDVPHFATLLAARRPSASPSSVVGVAVTATPVMISKRRTARRLVIVGTLYRHRRKQFRPAAPAPPRGPARLACRDFPRRRRPTRATLKSTLK